MHADATLAIAMGRRRPWSRVMGLGSIYAKTVRDSRRAAILVGVIGGLTMLATAAPYGTEFTTPESRANLVAQMGALPAVFRGLLGAPVAIDTLGGWISFRAGNFLPVLLALWNIIALSGTLSGEAAKGSLELVASTPVGRRSIALQKVAGHLTALAFAVLLITVFTYLASSAFAVFPQDRFGLDRAFGFALLSGLLMLVCGAAAFAAAPFVGRARGVAVGMLVLFGGYILWSYSSLSSIIDNLSFLSPFAWTAGHRPLAGETDWPSVGLLVVVIVGLIAIGVTAFVRRDLGDSTALSWVRLPSLPAGVRGPISRQLADRLGVAIGWGVGIGVYGALIAASAKQFAEAIVQIPQIQAYIKILYPGVDILAPTGLLQLAFYGFGSLVIGIAGATAIAGWATDESDGRLEIVMSAPLSRVRWFLGSSLGVMLAIAITTALVAGIVSIAVIGAGGDVQDVVFGTAVLGLAAAGFAGMGLAVGGLVRSSLAAPVAAGLILGTFLLQTIGAFLNLPDAVLQLSLYKHLGQPIAGIYDPVGIVAALVMAIGGVALGAWGLQRRDLDR